MHSSSQVRTLPITVPSHLHLSMSFVCLFSRNMPMDFEFLTLSLSTHRPSYQHACVLRQYCSIPMFCEHCENAALLHVLLLDLLILHDVSEIHPSGHRWHYFIVFHYCVTLCWVNLFAYPVHGIRVVSRRVFLWIVLLLIYLHTSPGVHAQVCS